VIDARLSDNTLTFCRPRCSCEVAGLTSAQQSGPTNPEHAIRGQHLSTSSTSTCDFLGPRRRWRSMSCISVSLAGQRHGRLVHCRLGRDEGRPRFRAAHPLPTATPTNTIAPTAQQSALSGSGSLRFRWKHLQQSSDDRINRLQRVNAEVLQAGELLQPLRELAGS
jgi:hypothetical protein